MRTRLRIPGTATPAVVRAAVIAASMLFVSGATRAQGGAAPPDSTTIVRRRAELTSDLRLFATSQEAFFKDYGHFARSVHDLAEITKFEATQGVTIVLLTTSDVGYSVIAIHRDAPELVCAFWLGKAPPPLGGSDEGRVSCRVPAGGPRVP